MGTGTHHHDTAFSIVKALGIVAVVISHAAILTPLETFTYYFNTAVFFFVAGYFFDDGQTAAPGRFIGRKLRRLYLPYVILGTLFVLLHNRFLEWHLIAYDFSAREAILPYDTPELLRTLGRVFLFLHHEQMQAPFWFLQGLFLGLMLFFCITLATRKLAPTPTVAERLRGGSILFLFTVAMLLARHPSGIPGEWIAVRTFAITGIIYLGKLFRIFRARLPLDGRIATLCLVTAGTGSSVGVSKAKNREALLAALTNASKYDSKILVEEFINGREVEVAVLGNAGPAASVCGEIDSGTEFYDYDAKYISDCAQLYIPARIPEEVSERVRDNAIRIYEAMGCRGLSRVDFFVTYEGQEIVFNEINTLPGFTSISMYPKLFEASGIPYPELLDNLIELALED